MSDSSAATSSDSAESGLSRIWFWWRIIWAILRNLIYLGLLLLAFDRTQSEFEVIVLSLLVLILQGVTWSSTARVRMDFEEGLVQRRLSFSILEKLGEDTLEAESVINDLEKKYLRNNPIYYINLAVASLVYLGILFKLVTTLL
jgi:hypothetical protein